MGPAFLLPNLRVLRWSPYVFTPHIPIIFIQKLLSPTLVSLTAALAEADGATLLSFFDSYPLLCRDLKSVDFRFLTGPPSPTTIQALSRAICNQENLENVVLDVPIDDIALRHYLPSRRSPLTFPKAQAHEHALSCPLTRYFAVPRN